MEIAQASRDARIGPITTTTLGEITPVWLEGVFDTSTC